MPTFGNYKSTYNFDAHLWSITNPSTMLMPTFGNYKSKYHIDAHLWSEETALHLRENIQLHCLRNILALLLIWMHIFTVLCKKYLALCTYILRLSKFCIFCIVKVGNSQKKFRAFLILHLRMPLYIHMYSRIYKEIIKKT